MGDENKYVPEGCYLTCDKGSAPSRLKVTHNNGVSLYGDKMASETDMIPNVNILPMGACTITRSACQLQPVFWDKTMENVTIGGYKLLIDEAKLICKAGGKVKIHFSLKAATETIAGQNGSKNWHFPFLDGLGIGVNSGAVGVGNQFGSLSAESMPFSNTLKGLSAAEIAAMNSGPKGNYGEILTTLDLQAKGYQITSNTQATTINAQTHQGLDIAAKDPKGNMDIVGDSKFKTGEGKPTLAKTTRGYSQLGNQWFNERGKNRLGNAMNTQDAARLRIKINTSSPDLIRTVAKVEPNGRITYYSVDAQGKVGNVINIPPAKAVAGSSKAASFINEVSRSVQSTKAISTANTWLVRNAATVSRVGKVAGRGLIVVGIAFEAINIGNAYQADGSKVGSSTKQAIGGAIGGLGMAIAGAKAGAIVGAMIGGPVGALVGAVAGGIIGGLIGSGVGKWVGGLF